MIYMKLNNKGFGISTMLIVGALFLIILVAVSIRISNIPKSTSTGSNSSDSTKNDNNYASLEEKLKKAGDSYSLYHDTLISYSSSSIKVTYDQLYEEGYINILTDIKTGASCDGYVVIDTDYDVTPYLKCDSYKTLGYED